MNLNDEMSKQRDDSYKAQVLTPEMSPFDKNSSYNKGILSKVKSKIINALNDLKFFGQKLSDQRTEKRIEQCNRRNTEQAKQLKARFGEDYDRMEKCLGIALGAYATQLDDPDAFPKIQAELMRYFNKAGIECTQENAERVWKIIS